MAAVGCASVPSGEPKAAAGVPDEEKRKMMAQNIIDFLHLDGVAESPGF